ncbi:hypothetical protein TNCV_536721 [Trichonephila clavipes]|nr:hypothetical protein TNCV_536721 [Trichonephila clavipes]
MTIILAWWLRYSFSDRKVRSSNLLSLVTLVMQKKRRSLAPSIQRKCNQAVKHMTQPIKPSPTNDATHKAVPRDDVNPQAVTHE